MAQIIHEFLISLSGLGVAESIDVKLPMTCSRVISFAIGIYLFSTSVEREGFLSGMSFASGLDSILIVRNDS